MWFRQYRGLWSKQTLLLSPDGKTIITAAHNECVKCVKFHSCALAHIKSVALRLIFHVKP